MEGLRWVRQDTEKPEEPIARGLNLSPSCSTQFPWLVFVRERKNADIFKEPTMCWVPYHKGNCLTPDEIRQWSPTFSAPGTGFGEDNFSTDRGWGGWFGHDLST